MKVYLFDDNLIMSGYVKLYIYMKVYLFDNNLIMRGMYKCKSKYHVPTIIPLHEKLLLFGVN